MGDNEPSDRPWVAIDHQQALDEGADAGTSPDCPCCGLTQDRHPTHYNAWVLLEPGPAIPGHIVPVGQRWRMDADGETVFNIGDGPPRPGEYFRIAHRLVCPAFKQGDVGEWLVAMRFENQRRSERIFDGRDMPDFPEAG